MSKALFHAVGTTPSRGTELKTAVTGGARMGANSFTTYAGMLSGPIAFPDFTRRKACSVFSTVTQKLAGKEADYM